VQGERADVQGEVENADEGRKRHAVEAVSVYECIMCDVTRSRGDTRLTVGAVDGTAGYPRTAKFLQFGGRFDSEGVALARIHIPQLSERLCGAGLVLARSSREMWQFEQVACRATQRLVWRVLRALYSGCQWRSLGRAGIGKNWGGARIVSAGAGGRWRDHI
jgi:hypothetical protein